MSIQSEHFKTFHSLYKQLQINSCQWELLVFSMSRGLVNFPEICALRFFPLPLFIAFSAKGQEHAGKDSCLCLLPNWPASKLSPQLAPAPTMLFNGLFSSHVKLSFTYTSAASCIAELSFRFSLMEKKSLAWTCPGKLYLFRMVCVKLKINVFYSHVSPLEVKLCFPMKRS